MREQYTGSKTLKVGTIVGGHYKVVSSIGSGAYSITYLVEDTHQLYKRYALQELYINDHNERDIKSNRVLFMSHKKSLEPHFEKLKKDVQHEVEFLQKLRHPNIVRAYGSFTENNTIYSIFEYIDGNTIKHIITNDGPKEGEEAIEIFQELLKGLQAIHRQDILHRDISFNNIMYDKKTSKYKFIDFTTLKEISEDIKSNSGPGTPSFAAPEVSRKKITLEPAIDIYALGMVFYYILTGQTAPESASRYSGDENTFQDELRELKVNQRYRVIIKKMTELDLKDRYKNVDEILKDIDSKAEEERETLKQAESKKSQEETVAPTKQQIVEKEKSNKKSIWFIIALLITGLIGNEIYDSIQESRIKQQEKMLHLQKELQKTKKLVIKKEREEKQKEILKQADENTTIDNKRVVKQLKEEIPAKLKPNKAYEFYRFLNNPLKREDIIMEEKKKHTLFDFISQSLKEDPNNQFLQYNMGYLYYKGVGVKENDTIALQWIKKAAVQNNANAQYALGVMYTKGQGVKQDYKEAVKWYKKAAAQNNADAQYNLKIIYDRGYIEKEDSNHSQKFSLTVNVIPKDSKDSKARVYITNIKPKYKDGIKLVKGKYKIKVIKDGYETQYKTINLYKNIVLSIVLKQRSKRNSFYDFRTTLTWQDQFVNKNNVFTYKEAELYCRNLGSKKWRLPTYNELLGIIDESKTYPSIDKDFRFCSPNSYWTSTKVVDNSGVIVIDFAEATSKVAYKSSKLRVRCVYE